MKHERFIKVKNPDNIVIVECICYYSRHILIRSQVTRDFSLLRATIPVDYQRVTIIALLNSLGNSLVTARNFQGFPSDQTESLPLVSLIILPAILNRFNK